MGKRYAVLLWVEVHDASKKPHPKEWPWKALLGPKTELVAAWEDSATHYWACPECFSMDVLAPAWTFANRARAFDSDEGGSMYCEHCEETQGCGEMKRLEELRADDPRLWRYRRVEGKQTHVMEGVDGKPKADGGRPPTDADRTDQASQATLQPSGPGLDRAPAGHGRGEDEGPGEAGQGVDRYPDGPDE